MRRTLAGAALAALPIVAPAAAAKGRYAQERRLPPRFTEREITRDPEYARTRVTARR